MARPDSIKSAPEKISWARAMLQLMYLDKNEHLQSRLQKIWLHCAKKCWPVLYHHVLSFQKESLNDKRYGSFTSP